MKKRSHQEVAPQQRDTTLLDQFIDDRAVSNLLFVSRATVIKWRRRGEGPRWVKLGTGPRAPIRYRLSDLDAYIQACAKQQTPPTEKAE